MLNYAKTPNDYKMGLLNGVNAFKFKDHRNRTFTMNPMNKSINVPVIYQGLRNGKVIDGGIAMPNENFNVSGDEVREFPMIPSMKKYQIGGTYLTEPITPKSLISIPPKPRDHSSLFYPRVGGNNVNDSYYDFSKPKTGLQKFFSIRPNKVGAFDLPVSSIYNLARSIIEKPVKETPLNNQYAARALSGLKNLKYTPDYSRLDLATNTIGQNIRQSTSSPVIARNNLLGQHANQLRAMNETDRNAANMNNQYQANYFNALNQEGAQRAAIAQNTRDRNQRHRAAKSQMINAGLTGIDKFTSNMRALKHQDLNNRIATASLNNKYRNYDFELDEDGNLKTSFRR